MYVKPDALKAQELEENTLRLKTMLERENRDHVDILPTGRKCQESIFD